MIIKPLLLGTLGATAFLVGCNDGDSMKAEDVNMDQGNEVQESAPTSQQNGISQLNYSCPGNIEVHASEGGPIYINGEEAEMKKFSDTYYEGKQGDVTISLTLMSDGSTSVTYTGTGGANGICQPSGG